MSTVDKAAVLSYYLGMKKPTKQKQEPKPETVYCVECGAQTELGCICDDLNFADGERVVINGEVYARVHE